MIATGKRVVAEDTTSVVNAIAHVEVFHDMAAVEAVWRRFEDSHDTLLTPYQRYDFQAAWQAHVGARENLRPFIAIAWGTDGRPLMLLPLGVRTENGVRIAHYLGGKHTSFNMPLWQRDFARNAVLDDVKLLLAGIQTHSEQIDVMNLLRQPGEWEGVINPLTLLPRQISANDCPVMHLDPKEPPASRVSNSFRRRLKTKERKLEPLPGYRYTIASDEAEIRRLLDAFFVIKRMRMAEQKRPDVFGEPGILEFIRQTASAKLPSGERAIEIHALECDEEVIGVFAGVGDKSRFSMMFNTYTMSPNAKYSPGLILVRNIIDHYAAKGCTSLDLGIGSDSYKRLFCKEDHMIYDSFIALNRRGSVAAMGMSSLARARRLVKQTPALMNLAQRLRNVFQRGNRQPKDIV